MTSVKAASIARTHHSSTSPPWGNCSTCVSRLLSEIATSFSACEEQRKDSLHPILSKDNVPKELQDPPALRVTLLVTHNPIPELFIVA